MKTLTLFILLLINFCTAQVISGNVVDTSFKPLNDVTVYLDGTKTSSKTDENGEFSIAVGSLNKVNIVFAKSGFASFLNSVADLKDKKVKVILERQADIEEVQIIPFTDNNFERNYQKFKFNFLGEDDRILIKNKKDLLFANSLDKTTFLAKAKKPLIIENKNLGYIIEYTLYEFETKEFSLRFLGSSFFTEMKGSEKQIKNWKENRKDAYYGSLTHFLRSLYEGKTKENNFIVHKARKILNPKYPSEIEIEKLNTFYKTFLEKNTVKLSVMPEEISDISNRQSNNSKFLLQIYEKNINENAYLKIKDGDKILDFDDLLMVITTINGKTVDTLLNSDGNEFIIYKEGNFSDPDLLILEGNWGRDKLNKLLPLDYEP